MSPTAWAALRKLKTQTGSNQSLLGAGTNDAAKTLLDVPVLVNANVPTMTGLIVDRANIVAAIGEVMVAQSEHYYFGGDNIALRVTFRFGAQLVNPTRHASFLVG